MARRDEIDRVPPSIVAAFHDPRFRFVNLARNHGEQSAANNEGVRLARGRVLAATAR